MDTSVPHTLAGTATSDSRSSVASEPTIIGETSDDVGGGRGGLAVIDALGSELAVTDAERQLVWAYLGNLIRQILLEPE